MFFTEWKHVGRVKKIWDGNREVYRSSINGTDITRQVIELEDGNAFMDQPGAYVVLAPVELRYYGFLQEQMAKIIQMMVQPAAQQGMGIGTTMLLLEAVLLESAKVARQAGHRGTS